MDRRKRFGTFHVALPAVVGALALMMLYVACVLPTGTWGWVAMAGLGPLAAVASLGVPIGFLCWGGVSILAILLLPDKFCVLLFTLLFGLYPMVKAIAERRKATIGKYAFKLLFFNLFLTVIFLIMGAFITATLPSVFVERVWLLYLVGNLVFMVYDLGLTKLIQFYLARVDRVIRRSGRFS